MEWNVLVYIVSVYLSEWCGHKMKNYKREEGEVRFMEK